MPDNGTITAMIVTVASALTAVGGAVKGLTDIKSTKDLVEIIGGEDGKSGLLGKVTARLDEAFKRIEEIADAADPTLRGDLNSLSEKVKSYRAELRARAAGSPVIQTGSFPSIESITSLGSRLDAFERRMDSFERRMEASEERSQRNESKIDKFDEFMGGARESLATIKTHLQHLLGKESS